MSCSRCSTSHSTVTGAGRRRGAPRRARAVVERRDHVGDASTARGQVRQVAGSLRPRCRHANSRSAPATSSAVVDVLPGRPGLRRRADDRRPGGPAAAPRLGVRRVEVARPRPCHRQPRASKPHSSHSSAMRAVDRVPAVGHGRTLPRRLTGSVGASPIDCAGDRDRDRPGQARPPRLLLRRRRDRALAAHPRPRGGQHRLADRRLPLRAPGPGRADGLGDVARDRDRVRPGSVASACSTSRASGPGTTTRRRCWRRSRPCPGADATARMQEIYAEPIKPELITERLRQMRDAGVTVAGSLSPQRTKEFAKTRRRRRRRHVRHPRHHGLRRARLAPGRAAEPQGVHLRARRPGHRRRLRHPPGRAAPDAHRRGRRARRLRRRRGAHHPHRARRRGPMATAVADVAAARRDYLDESGGRYVHVIADGSIGRVRRHRQGDRLRRRRGDGRLAVRARHRRPGPRLPLGRRGVPRRAAARRAGRVRHRRHAARRSCSAPRRSPTAR